MELYEEILRNYIKGDDIAKLIEMESYKALRKIKAIIEDNALTDRECFNKIEEIIIIFERLGSNCGNRHDFG